MAESPEIRTNAVAIYIRWSTEEQTEGTTLETQKERCSLYVRSQGWAVNPDLIFIDDGFSGGSLDRPALSRLRQMVRAGLVDCVVTYSMDRLSRSVADTVQLVQGEWLGKCIYRSASQPISTEDGNPTGQLIFNILASFAEFERALIRERTHGGLVRRAKQGMYPGSKVAPFGYRRDGKGHLVIDFVGPDGAMAGPAAVVQRMFAMAVSGPAGQGPTRIARALIADGIPSAQGGAWWAHQIRTILKNPVYCGDLVYGRRRVNPAHRRDKAAPQRLYDQKPLAVVADAIPALVSREMWNRAQHLFLGRAAVGARRSLQAKNRSLLTGIARCRCGGPLSLFYGRGKQRYYRCSRSFLSAGGCDHQPGVYSAADVEKVIIRAIMERYDTPALREAAMAQAATAQSNVGRRATVVQSIAEIDRRIKDVDEDLARVRRGARRGEIKLATFEELRSDAEAERQGLEARRATCESTLGQMQTSSAAAADWAAMIARVDLWGDLDVTRQREVLYGLLRRVVIFRGKGCQVAAAIDLEWEAP